MTLLSDDEAVPAAGADPAGPQRFTVRLHNFEGPFDLLLQLIGKHELDITEMALHRVTDDFIAHLKLLGGRLGVRLRLGIATLRQCANRAHRRQVAFFRS